MANSLEPRKVTVLATPTLLTDNRKRLKVDFDNTGAFDVQLGTSATMTEGFPLRSGAFRSERDSANPIYAISPDGNSIVWIWEYQ